MDVRVDVPEPVPTPPPRILVFRYGPDHTSWGNGDTWSLTVEDAREIHRKLGEALADPRLEGL